MSAIEILFLLALELGVLLSEFFKIHLPGYEMLVGLGYRSMNLPSHAELCWA